MLPAKIFRLMLATVITVFATSFVAAVLTRYAPGFNSEEAQLDTRLSSASLKALRDSRRAEQDIVPYYFSYASHIFRGDLGTSRSLNRPVRELLVERAPVTLRVAGLGLAMGWALALAFAITVVLARRYTLDLAATVLTGSLLCLPAAVLAFLSVLLTAPGCLAIAAIVLPKAFRYTRNLLGASYDLPHVLTARAKGLAESRILLWHVMPAIAPQLLALLGVSVSVALSAAIPIESLCGIPGIGQLAWQAAMGRDLPLLVNLTMVLTTVVAVSNMGADVANLRLESGAR